MYFFLTFAVERQISMILRGNKESYLYLHLCFYFIFSFMFALLSPKSAFFPR